MTTDEKLDWLLEFGTEELSPYHVRLVRELSEKDQLDVKEVKLINKLVRQLGVNEFFDDFDKVEY